jgi:hypothetical protein
MRKQNPDPPNRAWQAIGRSPLISHAIWCTDSATMGETAVDQNIEASVLCRSSPPSSLAGECQDLSTNDDSGFQSLDAQSVTPFEYRPTATARLDDLAAWLTHHSPTETVRPGKGKGCRNIKVHGPLLKNARRAHSPGDGLGNGKGTDLHLLLHALPIPC